MEGGEEEQEEEEEEEQSSLAPAQQAEAAWSPDYTLGKAEFLAELRGRFDVIEGLERNAEQYMRLWHARKMFLPRVGKGDKEAHYVVWLVAHTPGLTLEEKKAFLDAIDGQERPDAQTWRILECVLVAYAYEKGERIWANSDHTEGELLDEVMEADRIMQRDFTRSLAALKRAQVDMSDETGRVSETAKQAHRLAFARTCKHPWLAGRKRVREEDNTRIVTALMYNGPQPWTRDDYEWRRTDKLQRMSDVFVTAVPQSTLIQAEWKGFPIIPPSGMGKTLNGERRRLTDPYCKKRRARAVWTT